jgi:hypothetical protein
MEDFKKMFLNTLCFALKRERTVVEKRRSYSEGGNKEIILKRILRKKIDGNGLDSDIAGILGVLKLRD